MTSWVGYFFLTCSPARRVAPAVEAGDYHNPMLLHFEEEAIREAAHTRPRL